MVLENHIRELKGVIKSVRDLDLVFFLEEAVEVRETKVDYPLDEGGCLGHIILLAIE